MNNPSDADRSNDRCSRLRFDVVNLNDTVDIQRHHSTRVAVGILDEASRLVDHREWFCERIPENLIVDLLQVVQKYALPHTVMIDNSDSVINAVKSRACAVTPATSRDSKVPSYPRCRYSSSPSFWTVVTDRIGGHLR